MRLNYNFHNSSLSIEKDILINDINPIIPLLRPLTTTNNDGHWKINILNVFVVIF